MPQVSANHEMTEEDLRSLASSRGSAVWQLIKGQQSRRRALLVDVYQTAGIHGAFNHADHSTGW